MLDVTWKNVYNIEAEIFDHITKYINKEELGKLPEPSNADRLVEVARGDYLIEDDAYIDGEYYADTDYLTALNLLLEDEKNQYSVQDLNGALLLALYHRHILGAEQLLKKGAYIHVDNDYPLISAVREGDYKRAFFLIKHGSNIGAQNNRALRLAAIMGHSKIFNLLLDNGASIYETKLLRKLPDGDFRNHYNIKGDIYDKIKKIINFYGNKEKDESIDKNKQIVCDRQKHPRSNHLFSDFW